LDNPLGKNKRSLFVMRHTFFYKIDEESSGRFNHQHATVRSITTYHLLVHYLTRVRCGPGSTIASNTFGQMTDT
jgi:hypothetical protein